MVRANRHLRRDIRCTFCGISSYDDDWLDRYWSRLDLLNEHDTIQNLNDSVWFWYTNSIISIVTLTCWKIWGSFLVYKVFIHLKILFLFNICLRSGYKVAVSGKNRTRVQVCDNHAVRPLLWSGESFPHVRTTVCLVSWKDYSQTSKERSFRLV